MSELHDQRVARMKVVRSQEEAKVKEILSKACPTEEDVRRILSLAAQWDGVDSGQSLYNYIKEHFND